MMFARRRQQIRGLLAAYHIWAFRRHCAHLPSWFIVESLGGEIEERAEDL